MSRLDLICATCTVLVDDHKRQAGIQGVKNFIKGRQNLIFV
jgi:hypothetical protein